jgi:hypothetical protein
MAGITAGSALRRISWKCTGYWDIFSKQNTKIFPALKFYSTGKNGDVKEKNYIQRFQKLESEQRESLSSRLQKGINIGTWKFYVQDLVLKNLKPDIVPLSYRMCYRSGLETYANFGILTAALTSVFLSIAVPFYLFHQGSTPIPFEVAGFFFGGVICTFSLFSVSRQVPLRIYYSEECDDFLVYMPKYIPYAAKKLNIQPGHVKPPTGTSDYLPWINLQHTHTQTKQKMLIDGEKFILPMYYNKLMGYH